jgi:hypothetical protein
VFQEKTAKELSGYFDTEVWTRLILQVCNEEPFACHAVIAIGALNIAMETVQDAPERGLSIEARRKYGEPHHKFALQQYGKALKLMRDLPRESKFYYRNALMSCLLTTCFENYIGNQDAALAQAQVGINLLIEREKSVCAGKPSLSYFLKSRSAEDNDLFSTFARLETLVSMFQGVMSQVPSRLLSPLGPEDSASFRDMPAVFDSVREARICWDLSIKRALRWKNVYLHHANFSFLDLGENNITDGLKKTDDFSKRLRIEAELFNSAKEQWLRAFRPLFDRSRKDKGSKDFLGASVLMIKFLSSTIATALQGSKEAHCDVFLQDFIMLVDLARDLLENSPSDQRRAVVLFDDSLVASLFNVATRCRERGVRKEAIELLQRYPRREGLWDSEMAVAVCTWVMNQEEEGMVDGQVPEAARLRIVKTDLRLSERKVIISCSKLMEGSEQRIDLPEVTLTW